MRSLVTKYISTVCYNFKIYIQVNDIGGSMVVHAFGAYFGLALSFVIYKRKMLGHENEGSNYNSDIFSMIGMLFILYTYIYLILSLIYTLFVGV